MKFPPFPRLSLLLTIFRIILSALLMAHGISRLEEGSVNDFGGFLNDKGFMIGPAIAWFLTIFEIAGGLVMMTGRWVRWIAAIFIIEIAMGIILVHAANGWFVVGRHTGGVEYSVLLIFSLLLVGAADESEKSEVRSKK